MGQWQSALHYAYDPTWRAQTQEPYRRDAARRRHQTVGGRSRGGGGLRVGDQSSGRALTDGTAGSEPGQNVSATTCYARTSTAIGTGVSLIGKCDIAAITPAATVALVARSAAVARLARP